MNRTDFRCGRLLRVRTNESPDERSEGLWGPPCYSQTTSVPILFAQVPSPNGPAVREAPSVGAQYLRDGDVVALEFPGVAGGGAVYGWG